MPRQTPFDDEFRVGQTTGFAVNRPGYGGNELTSPGQTAAPPAAPTNQGYDDPYTSLMTNLATNRIGQLSQPFSDPMLDEVVNLIRGRVGQIQSTPTGFSEQESDRLTTRAWDGLERRRQAEKQRNLEDLSRRGVADSSGVLFELNRGTDAKYDQDRTRSEADTNIWMSQEENTRKTQQNSQLMQLAGMLSEVSATQRGETRSNQNDMLQIATMLSNLGPQRLAMAMQVLNGSGGDLSGLFNNTLNLSNSQQTLNTSNSQGREAMLTGLGQVISSILAQYGTR